MILTDKNLDLHLAFLLFQEDLLAVPGLGTFSVRRYGAEIQLPAGLILPPARRVSFAPNVLESDARLLDHIAQAEGITLHEAQIRVANQVCAWQQILQRGDRLTLRGIGSLRRIEATWVFSASLEANFLAESYGLPMVRMDVLSNLSAFTPILVERPAPRIRSWQAAAVVAGALGLAAIGGSKDDVRGRLQSASMHFDWKSWWSERQGEGLVPATSVQSWSADRIATDETPKTLAPTNTKPVTEAHEASPPSVALTPHGELVNSKTEPPVAKTPSSKSNAPVSYALIVGSFGETRYADHLAEQLRNSGYPATVIQSEVGLKKVAIRTFPDETSAQRAKARLKPDFPGIWIFIE